MGVVLLVRHGQASFGAEDYDVLSETGWEQARLLGPAPRRAGRRARTWSCAAACAGTARPPRACSRARAGRRRPRSTRAGTSSTTSGSWRRTPTSPTDELDRREFQHVFELATARWTGGEHDADYPEPLAGFSGRVGAALARALERAGSGGPSWWSAPAARSPPLRGPRRPDGGDPAASPGLWGRFNTVMVNTSVTRVVVGSTGARLLTFNEHAHLAGDTLTYR